MGILSTHKFYLESASLKGVITKYPDWLLDMSPLDKMPLALGPESLEAPLPSEMRDLGPM